MMCVNVFISHCKDSLAQAGWVFVCVIFIASFIFALFDNKDGLERIRSSTGKSKFKAISRYVFFWLLPVLSLFGAIGTQVASDKSDETIAGLTNTVGTLVESKNAISKQLVESIKDTMELGMAVLPRKYKHRTESVKHLKEHAGQEFLVAVDSGDECKYLAVQIIDVLTNANWVFLPGDSEAAKKYSALAGERRLVFFPGVNVEADTGPETGETRAADELVKELTRSDIVATRFPNASQKPPGVLVIRVGRRPDLSETKRAELLRDLRNSWGNRSLENELAKKFHDSFDDD